MNTQPPSPSQPSILVVDDVAENLRLMAATLKQAGYKVRPVSSGPLALEAARIMPPDLVLLDINMPGMNGYEVCERMKADASLAEIPVIFLSALNEPGDKVIGLRSGGVDYITKPFDAEEVFARIHVHLELRRLRLELRNQNNILEERVRERTAELAAANRRLHELGKLKDDFLLMISHEIRTPANGVLNIGELLLEEAGSSDLGALFHESSRRLRDLIDDATMIARMPGTSDREARTTLEPLLDEARAAGITVTCTVDPGTCVQGDRALLAKALRTVASLAAVFCREKPALSVGRAEDVLLTLRINLDALSLGADQAEEFFLLGSPVRSASHAESLGLAPVVAEKILSAFGGGLRLSKGHDTTGALEATLHL